MNTCTSRRALLAGLLVSMVMGAGTRSAAQSMPPAVSLQDARDALQNASAVVIDIREPDEHATGVAGGARLLPMSQLGKRISEIPKANDQPVLLMCHTQNRSARAAAQLRAVGYTNISYVTGGMSQWAMQQWPMVKPVP
jgi:rhodanese-related sulfurtransferase